MNEKDKLAIRIYEEFKDSLMEWPKTKLVRTNRYISKNVNNQLKRISSLGLTVDTHNDFETDIYALQGKDYTEDRSIQNIKKVFLSVLNNSNQTFNNQSLYINGIRTSIYYKNNKLLKKIKYENRLYVIVTSVNDEEKVLQHDVICPKCGNIVSMNELVNGTEGCCYCRTKFKVSDLYPVITNYYHYSNKIEKAPFLKYYLIINLIFDFPVYKIATMQNYNDLGFNLGSFNNLIIAFIAVISALIVSLIFTAMAIFARQLLLGAKYYSGKGIKKSNYTKLENFIRQYDSNFTYYMFEGKMISMMKEIIFSENPKELAIYDCDKNIDFSNIIDVNFYELYINSTYLKDNKIYVDFTIEMNNTLYINNKIKEQMQKFNILAARNMNVYTVSNFRVDIINCKNCGASIDVEHDKNCKYCHTEYDYKDYDFVIEDIGID